MRAAAARYSAGDKERMSLPLRERALLAAADINKDGRIREEELTAAATRSARQQFAALDRDRDGRVTLEGVCRWGRNSRPKPAIQEIFPSSPSEKY